MKIYTLLIGLKQGYDIILTQGKDVTCNINQNTKKLLRVIKITLEVLWKDFKFGNFALRRGLRHGNFFSSVLFNLILEIIVRRSGLKAKETISL